MPIPENSENSNEKMPNRNKHMKDVLAGLNHPRGIRMPDKVQQACMVLEIRIPDHMIIGTEIPPKKQDEWTIDSVERAFKAAELKWKKMSGRDVGVELDAQDATAQKAAAYLYKNKEIVERWIRENPNLGGGDPNQPSGVPRKPLPGADSSAIALPLPKSETETEDSLSVVRD